MKATMLLVLCATSAAMFLAAAPARADDRDKRDRKNWDRDERTDDRDDKKIVVAGGRKPPVARPLRWGTVVTTLPRGHREVVLSGSRYYLHQGVCYSSGPRAGTFVVVRPPPGIVVTHIPSDYIVVEVDGRSYYQYDDCYYNDRLEVVEVPIGGWIAALPTGFDTVVVRNERIYRSGGLYFKAVIRGGKTIYVRIKIDPNDLDFGGQWEALGSARISFRGEEESIPSSLLRGRFRQMRIEVTGGDAEIYDIAVRFANGEIFKPNIRHRFEENSRSRIIDLPGDERFIKEVRFVAKSNLSLSGKATITIAVR